MEATVEPVSEWVFDAKYKNVNLDTHCVYVPKNRSNNLNKKKVNL